MFILNKAAAKGYYGKKPMTQEEFDKIIETRLDEEVNLKIVNRNLSGLDMSNSKRSIIDNISFYNCNMIGCNFNNTLIRNSKIANCNLDNSSFYHTNIDRSTIYNSSFNAAYFNRFKMYKVRIRRVNVRNTRFINGLINLSAIIDNGFTFDLFKKIRFIESNLVKTDINDSIIKELVFDKDTRAFTVNFNYDVISNTDMAKLNCRKCLMSHCVTHNANLLFILSEALLTIKTSMVCKENIEAEEKKLCLF